MVAGPMGCGKTTFVTQSNLSCRRSRGVKANSKPLTVIYPTVCGYTNCCSFDASTRNLEVIDDLMAKTNEGVTTLFIKKSSPEHVSAVSHP